MSHTVPWVRHHMCEASLTGCERCFWIQLLVSWKGPSPRIPMVLEFCQWDEGRGLSPGSVGYPGDSF